MTAGTQVTIEAALLAQARSGQRDMLARAIQLLLRKALQAERVMAQDIEDLVQDKSPRLTELLVEGRVEPGSEDAYIRRCGQLLARAHWRRQRRDGVVERREHFEDVVDQGADEDKALQERELAEQVQVLREVMRSSALSPEQRRLLEHAYVDGIDPGTLAQRDLADHPLGRDGQPRSLKQARNKIDQNLKRARDSLGELVRAAWQQRLS